MLSGCNKEEEAEQQQRFIAYNFNNWSIKYIGIEYENITSKQATLMSLLKLRMKNLKSTFTTTE